MPINASPEQMNQLTSSIDLNQLREAQVEGQLKGLLERQTLPKLQQLAKRRGWTLTAQNKTVAVNELAKQLRESPLPTDFTPEEKQLLSIANTLYGFADSPTQPQLQQWWKKRGGGDQSRFDRALNGLQTAGVLFACPGEGFGPHFHWSPFIDPADAPLLDLKIKPYPADQAARLRVSPPMLPVPHVLSSILQMAEPKLTVKEWAHEDQIPPTTFLPTFEALACAQAQGHAAAFELSWALRHAVFAESRNISMRHEIFAQAERVAKTTKLDVAQFKKDWDSGKFRSIVLAESTKGWTEIKVDGKKLLILKEGDVLAIVEGESKAVAKKK